MQHCTALRYLDHSTQHSRGTYGLHLKYPSLFLNFLQTTNDSRTKLLAHVKTLQ